ncbi:unnamed protein product [Prorocentrum cordatum]|uniref:Uncharacterized protein n=1 Tax=Prorocentrum cordatum TaxID=2364126 RepID=A0ABN9Y6G6_9DINO|nr:unnamed protein product [Polarella glacialis]
MMSKSRSGEPQTGAAAATPSRAAQRASWTGRGTEFAREKSDGWRRVRDARRPRGVYACLAQKDWHQRVSARRPDVPGAGEASCHTCTANRRGRPRHGRAARSRHVHRRWPGQRRRMCPALVALSCAFGFLVAVAGGHGPPPKAGIECSCFELERVIRRNSVQDTSV